MKKTLKILKNILAFFQGTIRYKLYYTKFKFLIRKHIREQIEVRINSMDRKCFEDGQCKLCGCKTTALQMADKSCGKPCYPKMLSKKEWKKFKTFGSLNTLNGLWVYNYEETKLRKI